MPISGGQSMAAVDVWDVLVAAITTPGSIGEVLDDLTAAKIAFIDQAISTMPFTPYAYGPTELANNATFVPPAKTIVTMAWCELVSAESTDFMFYNPTDTEGMIYSFDIGEGKSMRSIPRVMYCDGVVGFRNVEGNAQDITLWGLTMV